MTGPVKRLNDDALEYLILWLRLMSILMVTGVVVSAVGFAWTGDGRWMATWALTLVFGALFTWSGWWYWGNSSWRRNENGS